MNNCPVSIEVETSYLDAQSNPEQNQFVFAYTITVVNQAEQSLQILTRSWSISDAEGKVTEVAGEGVVGKQPHIAAGKSFTYTSGTVINTPVGSMEGSYGVIWADGEEASLPIPPFRLAIPNIVH